MAVIEETDKAVRLARTIASDINLYNAEKIQASIENDTFFDALAAELNEGRELYKTRVSPRLDGEAQLYDQAVVNIIVRSKGHIRSKMW